MRSEMCIWGDVQVDCGTINTKPENSLEKGSRSYITDRKAITALPGGREDEGDDAHCAASFTGESHCKKKIKYHKYTIRTGSSFRSPAFHIIGIRNEPLM